MGRYVIGLARSWFDRCVQLKARAAVSRRSFINSVKTMQNEKVKRQLKTGTKILETFLSVADEMHAVCVEGHHPSTILRYGVDGARYFSEQKERRLERARLKRLEQRKFIKIRKVGDEYHARLTDEGAVELMKQKVMSAPMLDPDFVCMVIFDVPESKRKLRHQIRAVLKEAGFIPIQKSVWVCPYDAGDALREFLKIKSAIQWVRIYDAKEH